MATTLSYNETTKGWVSFHSYEPEWMERLGADFYSFKDGNIYKHALILFAMNFMVLLITLLLPFQQTKLLQTLRCLRP